MSFESLTPGGLRALSQIDRAVAALRRPPAGSGPHGSTTTMLTRSPSAGWLRYTTGPAAARGHTTWTTWPDGAPAAAPDDHTREKGH